MIKLIIMTYTNCSEHKEDENGADNIVAHLLNNDKDLILTTTYCEDCKQSIGTPSEVD